MALYLLMARLAVVKHIRCRAMVTFKKVIIAE
ncbi:uncharacterized protein DMAD_13619 [Drosophila madeirensis]|uniref:Uncharacterized protein n=1 Tax=Drosophila madeirensis TaxID=30013 RepID=A0AAU9GF19_DROMD